jgi:hypothetical protein
VGHGSRLGFAPGSFAHAVPLCLWGQCQLPGLRGQPGLQPRSRQLLRPASRPLEDRSDDIYTFGLGLGYRFTYYLSLWGTYLYEDRDTLYRYSYTTNIFTLGLVFGF